MHGSHLHQRSISCLSPTAAYHHRAFTSDLRLPRFLGSPRTLTSSRLSAADQAASATGRQFSFGRHSHTRRPGSDISEGCSKVSALIGKPTLAPGWKPRPTRDTHRKLRKTAGIRTRGTLRRLFEEWACAGRRRGAKGLSGCSLQKSGQRKPSARRNSVRSAKSKRCIKKSRTRSQKFGYQGALIGHR
jgi:hypothetical protein